MHAPCDTVSSRTRPSIGEYHCKGTPATCARFWLCGEVPLLIISGHLGAASALSDPTALKNSKVRACISNSRFGGTHPWPIHKSCESVLSRSRPSCSRIASLMVFKILSAECSARSVSSLSWSGSVYCRICLMSNGYRVMRCTEK